MKKSKLPLTVLNAKKITKTDNIPKLNSFISVKKLQTKKIEPYGFYRTISKIVTDFDEQ